MKNLHFHNSNMHIFFFIKIGLNINVLGRIFLNSHRNGCKDEVFYVRCKRTYVLAKIVY